jgi:hypothetical protein
MLQMLEVLITFVGVILVMALAAQSIQEIIKMMFAIKGRTSLEALKGLLVESSKANQFPAATGETIFIQVLERLRGLGQDGVRPKAVRLDSLGKEDLCGIIKRVAACEVDGIKALDPADGQKKLEEIATSAEGWYDLAMSPVGDRYRRRMRGYALLSSAVVVFALNADAIGIFRQASTDPEYRKAVIATVSELNDKGKIRRQLEDSLAVVEHPRDTTAKLPAGTTQDTSTADSAQAGDSTETPAAEPDTAAIRVLKDSIHVIDSVTTAQIDSVLGGQAGFVIGDRGDFHWSNPTWWIGIVVSILLVSLGAPFWHDLLEALFGLKNRIRAQANSLTAEARPEVTKKIPG